MIKIEINGELREVHPCRKSILRSYMRKYFNGYLSDYTKESKKDSFILNMALNYVYSIFKEDFLLSGHKEKDFDAFFKSVFKDKIKLIKCGE